MSVAVTALNGNGLSFFFFLAVPQAYRILVPQPGIEPGPLAMKVQSPNHWTAREFSGMGFSMTGLEGVSQLP